eukprot:6464263-Amphidinium_carterae.2
MSSWGTEYFHEYFSADNLSEVRAWLRVGTGCKAVLGDVWFPFKNSGIQGLYWHKVFFLPYVLQTPSIQTAFVSRFFPRSKSIGSNHCFGFDTREHSLKRCLCRIFLVSDSRFSSRNYGGFYSRGSKEGRCSVVSYQHSSMFPFRFKRKMPVAVLSTE